MENSIMESIRRKISQMEPGTIFDYSNFDSVSELALAKSLSRLEQEGIITRLTKGKYYKPRETAFGKIGPTEADIIQALTQQNKSRVGYITGAAAYNRLGLTTQVPNTLVIATTKQRKPQEIKGYKIRYVQREVPINESNIHLLQVLDALKDIKNIPDAPVDQSLNVLKERISQFSIHQKEQLAKLALKYNAATKALIGAILEKQLDAKWVDKIYKSLNPLSFYEIGVDEKLLPNKSNWNIK